ncbi:hypothetical protein DRO24_03625 [Candidatus Bathyarchaeota archaeon]|nr:MAG: hypothetical protein DRO24_03625 [Candidatus Bathyarchaeota archaeon]
MFVDFDLKGEAKKERTKREIKELMVDVIGFIYSKLSAICPNSIKILDSGGGAYFLIDHTVTSPIAKEFEGNDRGLVFKDLMQRYNDLLSKIEEEIERRFKIKGIAEIDTLNHKNRLMKTPLSIHKSMPYVVHPIDPENIDFEPVEIPISFDVFIESMRWVSKHPSKNKRKRI